MKKNALLEEYRRSKISPETRKQIDLQVGVANRIYEILEERNMTQKEFAQLMGKTENEVSRWLSGTHNMTCATIAKISCALGEDIIQPTHKKIVISFDIIHNENYTFSTKKELNFKQEKMVINY